MSQARKLEQVSRILQQRQAKRVEDVRRQVLETAKTSKEENLC